MERRLTAYWSGVFRETPTDARLYTAMLRRFGVRLEVTAQRPTSGDLRATLRRARPSAPGQDGIPARAWLIAGERAHSILHRMLIHLCSGGSPPPTFNHMLLLCTQERGHFGGAESRAHGQRHTPTGPKEHGRQVLGGGLQPPPHCGGGAGDTAPPARLPPRQVGC